MKRRQVIDEEIDDVIDRVKYKIDQVIKTKGDGEFVSPHEIVGSIEEERYEFIQAVHVNDRPAMKSELLDIAVTCIWGVCSL